MCLNQPVAVAVDTSRVNTLVIQYYEFTRPTNYQANECNE